MKMLNKKKGAFQMITNGMIAFIGFMLVAVLTLVLVAQVKTIDVVKNDGNATIAMSKMQTAAALPADFAQIIILVVIIVGILGLLAFIGFSAYQKMR